MAMRHAIWFDQARPRDGVLRLVLCKGEGEEPQPVKKRCWWSSVRGKTVRFGGWWLGGMGARVGVGVGAGDEHAGAGLEERTST